MCERLDKKEKKERNQGMENKERKHESILKSKE